MKKSNHSMRTVLLAGASAFAIGFTIAWPTLAADVTADRLVTADKEPHNWLMNHRTYDAQRYSPLAPINKGNVRGLKLTYAIALGGSAGNEYNEAHDTTLDELWKVNIGSGFSAPPMTFEFNGKQYLAIAAGPSPQAPSKHISTPELSRQRNATVLYVFGLSLPRHRVCGDGRIRAFVGVTTDGGPPTASRYLSPPIAL